MWPFKRETRAPWIEEQLQRTHLVALELERRIGAIENVMQQLGEAVSSARAIENRITRAETALRAVVQTEQDDYARLLARIEQVQGLATGARGGRPRNEERAQEREAMLLGMRIIQALQTPEGTTALIQELQTRGAGAPADPVGAGSSWNPRVNGAGPSPVG